MNSTHPTHSTCVLIPAAAPVQEGVLSLGNVTCPAMIPVGGRPLIYWTIRYLLSLGLREYVVAVAQRGMFVEEFVECTFGSACDVTFMVPESDHGVGGTVADLAEHAKADSALVVLGDTHLKTTR